MPEQLKKITRTPVQSSTLASVGWCEEGSVLEVEFKVKPGKPPAVYQYEGVPEWIYRELINPEFTKSRGEFFDRTVKKSGYNYWKVEEAKG